MSCTESEKSQYRAEWLAELVGRSGVMPLVFVGGKYGRCCADDVHEAIAALQAKHEQEVAKYRKNAERWVQLQKMPRHEIELGINENQFSYRYRKDGPTGLTERVDAAIASTQDVDMMPIIVRSTK